MITDKQAAKLRRRFEKETWAFLKPDTDSNILIGHECFEGTYEMILLSKIYELENR